MCCLVPDIERGGNFMSLDDLPSFELVNRWKNQNDQQAADLLVRRYAGRLIALARSKLPGRTKRRLDPEDIMQSVCRTFFVRVRDGRTIFIGDSVPADE